MKSNFYLNWILPNIMATLAQLEPCIQFQNAAIDICVMSGGNGKICGEISVQAKQFCECERTCLNGFGTFIECSQKCFETCLQESVCVLSFFACRAVCMQMEGKAEDICNMQCRQMQYQCKCENACKENRNCLKKCYVREIMQFINSMDGPN